MWTPWIISLQMARGPSLLFQIPPTGRTCHGYYASTFQMKKAVCWHPSKLSEPAAQAQDPHHAEDAHREFDNFKRVFKVVEEMKGPLVENIHQNFLLSDRLARDYAAIVFFANSRFETGKKKLQYLTFEDFAFCAEQLIQNWTLGAVDSMVEDMDVDLDKEFLQDLKDLKVLITDKDMMDQHKSLVCTALRGKLQVFSEMEGSFKNLSRGLVNIAGKLMNNKDVRDLFIDLVEKFIEPCKSDKWSLNDVRLFLTQHTNSVRALDAFKHQAVWERYMRVIQSCILKMYHD
ncbi:acidic fibroblast growth factor intracellular-binding protein isoform X1 [Huso huso]|uniref:Acidic fibroblast growth factor intracellular-binding protein isoform X1 n=1 Tax=Huso huso TaxID=61971 RepID=A0ABR0YYP1_HUSHU